MITIKNKVAIERMYYAGQVLADLFHTLPSIIKAGMNTGALDAWIENYLKERGIVSETKGYRGYQHASCISVNDEVVHGIPRKDKIIREGDLIKIDICGSWKDYCADAARSYIVGSEKKKEVQQLIDVAQKALDRGIEKAQVGNRLGDISAAIQHEIEQHGYAVVRDFAGHGIGKHMHEDPEILNYGKVGQGPLLRSGMAFALEPMLVMGNHEVVIADDGWTVKTKDKSLAAHVEDTIVLTEQGPRILTRKNGES